MTDFGKRILQTLIAGLILSAGGGLYVWVQEFAVRGLLMDQMQRDIAALKAEDESTKAVIAAALQDTSLKAMDVKQLEQEIRLRLQALELAR